MLYIVLLYQQKSLLILTTIDMSYSIVHVRTTYPCHDHVISHELFTNRDFLKLNFLTQIIVATLSAMLNKVAFATNLQP